MGVDLQEQREPGEDTLAVSVAQGDSTMPTKHRLLTWQSCTQ